MKNFLIATVGVLLVAFLIGSSTASPDPSAVLYVQPPSAPGTGPWVISSPATLEVGITANEYSQHGNITNIWLILVLNDDTYNHLVKITTTVTGDFLHDDFINPDTVVPSEDKIPRLYANTYNDPNYPGYDNIHNEQYPLGQLKSAMYGGPQNTIYYFVKVTTIPVISKDNPATFTITVDAPGATQLKVLLLAIGYSAKIDDGLELNEHSALTNSTFVVPEIATVLLALAPIAGFGLYTYKQRKTNRNTT